MLIIYIVSATVLVSLISFVGIVAVYRNAVFKDGMLKKLISLAAGALLAVTFLDLLPEAVEGVEDARAVFMMALVSFLLFFILEKYLHWHHCRCIDHDPEDPNVKQHLVLTNLIGDGVHNIVDGFLIATAFMLDMRIGVITTLAVIVHEIPQEISDFGILLYAGMSKARALFFNFLFALTAVLGGIVFYFFGQHFSHLIPFMAAFAAGNFIYLSASDLIPELDDEKNAHNVIMHTGWLLLGVAVIYAVSIITPHV